MHPSDGNQKGDSFFIMYKNNNIETPDKSTKDVLIDKSKTGKERPWREKKIASIGYSELLHILEFKKAQRVHECGEILEFTMNVEGRLKLFKAWFCKSPLCPMCNWRRSMKHSFQAEKIVAEVMNRKPKARWLFLTLSVRNAIDGETLHKSLRRMSEGFRKLFGYKKVKKNLIGFMRATEVTVNEIDGSYNQHFHVLLCVESSYFKDSDNYIAQKEWTSLWKRAMKLDYQPIVHIEAIKPKNKRKSDIKSAIDETAKYPVKDSDYLTDDQAHNLEVVQDLETGLYRKRRISYGGLLKEIHKQLNLDNVEDGNLVNTGDEENEKDEKAYSVVAIWNWKQQNYYLKK